MELIYTASSPYARMVRLLAAHLGVPLALKISSPSDNVASDQNSNPLGKVPCLVATPVGDLFDSAVICKWLDFQFGESQCHPRGELKWQGEVLLSLIRGTIDQTVCLTLENRRPEGHRDATWLERYKQSIIRSLNRIEQSMETVTLFPILEISLAAALSYIEFRHPDFIWRVDRPQLRLWYMGYGAHSSFKNTEYS